MRSVSNAVPLFLLIFGACLAIGCSEKSTEPENNPPPSTEMKHLWSECFGDAGDQRARAVATDASGNVIVTGSFSGTVDFGGGPLTGERDDMFVAKFGPSGTHLWSKRFGDEMYQYGYAVAVDALGNVIITGYFWGTVDFGGEVLTSDGGDGFVAKFGPDGTYLWSKRFGGGGVPCAQAVTVDASGKVIVAGYFEGAVDFGGGELMSAGGTDIFVAKFASNGAHLWSKSVGNGVSQGAQSVAVDASGNVIVTGYFSGAVDFGGGVLTSEGSYDIFLAKFEPDGAYLWSVRFGDGDNQLAHAVAVDASGNVIVTGYFSGTVDFGGGAFTSAGGSDIFVAKFGANGTHLWSEHFGDGDFQVAYAGTVDASGNVIITGFFKGTVDFGGEALTSAGMYDIFVAKLGSGGAHLWSESFSTGNSEPSIAEVSVDASGNVLIAGCFWGSVDFGGGALTSAGQYDNFIAKFGR